MWTQSGTADTAAPERCGFARSVKTRLRDAILFPAPALALAVLSAVVVATGTDQSTFLWINRHTQIFGGAFLQCVTILGDGLVAIVIVLPFVRSRPGIAWNTLISSLIVLVCVQGIKHFFGSARPLEVLPADTFKIIGSPLRAGAFPSGHAATAFMLAGIVALHFRRAWIRVGVVVAAVVIATSRIGVGVHWPTDSLVGGLIGWLSAGIGFRLTGKTPYLEHPVTRGFLQLLLAGGAVSMLVYDHTSYASSFRFQQILAAACLAILALQILMDLRPMPQAESSQ